MSDLKTRPTGASVTAFVASVEPATRRAECQTLKKIMSRATGHRPKMWGEAMVGYGQYHYKYDSGREGDYFLTGFAPRKGALSVYIMPGVKQYTDLLAKLGPHKHSVSCLYLKSLEDIDLKILEQMIKTSVADMRHIYPQSTGR